MIDTDFIIRYTNGLYSTESGNSPRYDEFRDMFSSGQLKSKQWLIDQLDNYSAIAEHAKIAIAGSWFGTLGLMLAKQYPESKLSLIDIDPRCETFVKKITYDMSGVNCVTQDMYEYVYREDIIINTSCEHIPDLREWLNIIPINKTVILQSNNFIEGDGHINCVLSSDEFVKQSGLTKVWYSGSLVMPMYTRYMIIGMT